MLYFKRGRIFGFVIELKYLYSTTQILWTGVIEGRKGLVILVLLVLRDLSQIFIDGLTSDNFLEYFSEEINGGRFHL